MCATNSPTHELRMKSSSKPFTGQGFEVIAAGPKKYNAVKLHWCARCFC